MRRNRYPIMIRPLSLLLCLGSLCFAGDDKKPDAPAAPAPEKKAPEVRIISDWKDWKKQSTDAADRIEIKADVPETNPPKDVKRAELPAEAKKAGVLILHAGRVLNLVKYEGKEELLPREGYEIAWDGMRLEGADFFSTLTFPVGKPDKDGKDTCVSLVTGGWGGWVLGISSIGHQFANENETTKSVEFETGRWYRFTLQVTPEVIRLLLDGKEQFKVDVRDRALTMHPSDVRRCMPLGFSTYQTTGAIRNLQIRKLGKDELKPDPEQ